MLKKTVRRLLTLVLGGALLYGVFWPGNGNQSVVMSIKAGDSGRAVAAQLQSLGLIRSPYPFLIWVKVRRASGLIHVGRYRFSVGRSAYWLVDDLIQGRTEKAKFVIPEGFASWQIAERLQEAQLCDPELFKNAVKKNKAEGFLFPATYDLEYGLSSEELVRLFRAQFDKVWTSELQDRANELGWTREKTVTLASILEREIRVRSELPLVSAVYNNRLKKGMRLEADPTVQFAFGYWKTRLTYNDYKNTKSPYNTYLQMGLPPGPICSPGLDSIRAALWPAESDALFLLAQEDGHHTFSNNYRDHTNKVNRRNRSQRTGLRK